ncbi:MAG TPA: outer membrane beta-barrel protein [Verrucomicrobiae bacterium]|jgi:opacity protein-like surface antigen|nr:outer membrane beta-barrel protein [Verrucomicrobiae bacterium]
MKIQRIGVIIVSLFTASLAQAQYSWNGPGEMGPYFRAGVGPTIFQDSELRGFSVFGTQAPNSSVHYDVGFAFDGAIGFNFDKYVGLDFETGYIRGRMNDVPGYFAHGSTMSNVPFLANLTLSFPLPHSNVVPYVGAGAGGAASIFDAHDFTYSGGSQPFIDGSASDGVFAGQLFAGVRFMLDPHVSLGVGYKFFATGDPSFSGNGVSARFQGVRTHSILVTFQANF